MGGIPVATREFTRFPGLQPLVHLEIEAIFVEA